MPVLSSSSTSTSPAASTARPLIASTFFCTSRSMPAMPMALSRPPMVVGIRQTSSATSTGMEKSTPDVVCRKPSTTAARPGRSRSARTAGSSARSRWAFSGVSRLPPGAIMRSRNVSPGFDVMRILTTSESTRVPPVTALRSPPASRTTGADSPVIADSSTVAAPSMISPSPGINSPALTTTTSSLRNSSAVTFSVPEPLDSVGIGLRARLAQRIGLRLAAALGHGFGEIGKEHREPEPESDLEQEADGVAAAAREEQDRGDRRADFRDEHHRVPDQWSAG